jgi:hypothetical protein
MVLREAAGPSVNPVWVDGAWVGGKVRTFWPDDFESLCKDYGDIRPFLSAGAGAHIMTPENQQRWIASLHLVPVLFPHPIPLIDDHGNQTGWAHSALYHPKCAYNFKLSFQNIEDAGLWPELRNFGGSLCVRMKKSGKVPSTHALGIADDINTLRSPYGHEPNEHPGIIQAREAAGLRWGGKWPLKCRDGMHWQACELTY